MLLHQKIDYTYDDSTLSLFHQYSNNKLLDKKFIKDDKLILNRYNTPTLTIMLLLSGLLRDDIRSLTLAHALASHGLSVHDQIDNYDYNDFNKQLKILAGDLYYAQHFNILAVRNRISDIKLFSDAVSEINKEKMILHYSDITEYSLADYIESVEKMILTITYSLIDSYVIEKDLWRLITRNSYLANHFRQEQARGLLYNIRAYKENNIFNIYILLIIKSKEIKSKEELDVLIEKDNIRELEELNLDKMIIDKIDRYKAQALQELELVEYKQHKTILEDYIKSI